MKFLKSSKYFMSSFNCGSEIIKLFSLDHFIKLFESIPKVNVNLSYDRSFGHKIISKKIMFLGNLNRYIEYIRNNYLININELVIIIDLTLRNKFVDILFSDLDYFEDNNSFEYVENFRKMFLYNLYNNVKFYSKYVNTSSIINKFYKILSEYDFNDNNDILKIEELIIKLINKKKKNISDIFIPYNEIKEEHYNFYILKLEMFLNNNL